MLKSEWVSHQIENGICIFQIKGEIASTGIKEIDHYIKHYLSTESPQGVIIDVQVSMVDSTLIGCLIEQLNLFQKQHLKSAICGLEEDISYYFKNITLEQFAGVFSTQSEILQIWDRPQQRKTQSRALPKNKMDHTYYFVGPQKSWKLKHSSLLTIITLVCSTFVFLLGIIIFQSLYFELSTTNLNDELDTANQYLGTLKEKIQSTEEEYYALKEKIEVKNTSLSTIRLALEAKADQQGVLLKDRTLYNKKIKEIQEDIKKKELQFNKMKVLNSNFLQTIETLTQKVEDIKKKVAVAELQAGEQPSASTSSQEGVTNVGLEKLRVGLKQNKIAVQFNLRNKTKKVHSGFIMVTLVNIETASLKPIPFNIEQSQTYSIKRFRPFTVEFPISENPLLNAISVTVWDRQKKQLTEQILPLPSF